MKRNLCLVAVSVALLALSACKKGTENNGNNEDDDVSGNNGNNRVPAALYAVRGQVQDVNKQPLANVAVVAKTATATTDAEGRYQLKLPEGEAVIRFVKSNYVGTIKKVTVSEGYATMLHVKLLDAAPKQTIVAENGGLVEGTSNSNGAVSVNIPPSAFVDAQGNPASGNVSVQLTNIDPSDNDVREAAPGSFAALDENGAPVQLESGGMLQIDVRDASGDKLQLGANKTLDVKFPVAVALGANPPDMLLWSFKEATGQWVQEAGNVAIEHGPNGELHYVAELPHMSFWNIDLPLDSTCVTGRAINMATGEPLAGAQVLTSGVDYVGTSSTTTDANGYFRVPVKKNAEVLVTVQHQLGGGTSKTVYSEGTDTPIPPTSSTACSSAGEFAVTKDVFNYDGLDIDCTSATSSFQGDACLEEFSALGACPRVAGCVVDMSQDVLGISSQTVTMRWESGTKAVSTTNIDLTSGAMTMAGTFYNPEGEFCYDYTFPMVSNNSIVLTYADAQGRKFRIENKANLYTIECPNGQKVEMNTMETAALQACSGQFQPDNTCTPSGGGGGPIMRMCNDCPANNPTGKICCQIETIAICATEEACSEGGGTPIN